MDLIAETYGREIADAMRGEAAGSIPSGRAMRRQARTEQFNVRMTPARRHQLQRLSMVQGISCAALIERALDVLDHTNEEEVRTFLEELKLAKRRADKFCVACLEPGGEADVAAIDALFKSWDAEHPGETSLPSVRMASAILGLFDQVDITLEERNGRWIAVGVSLKEERLAA